MAEDRHDNTASIIAAAIDVSVKGASVDEFRKHIKKTLPHNVVKGYQLGKGKGQRAFGKILLRPSVNKSATVREYAQNLRHSTLNDKPIHAQVDAASLLSLDQPSAVAAASRTAGVDPSSDAENEQEGVMNWQDAKLVAKEFFDWLHAGNFAPFFAETVDLVSVDREQMHRLFDAFWKQHQENETNNKSGKRLESLVCASLRRQKLMRSKRYSDGVVICSFAKQDRTFPPVQERVTARDKLLKNREQMQANKNAVCVANEAKITPSVEVLPINQTISVEFPMESLKDEARYPRWLLDVRVEGSQAKNFSLVTKLPCRVTGAKGSKSTSLKLNFRSKATGVSRGAFRLIFQDENEEKFVILRTILLKTGDADMYDILKPKTPYEKKKRKFDKVVSSDNIVNPPTQSGRGEDIFKELKHFKPPLDVRELVESREIEDALVPPSYETPERELPQDYATFWQNMLWISELQAYEDIKLFDMENAHLQRQGRFFKLYVSGLAEGRPSVLRGDMVLCNWKGKQYRGRVFAVELLDVLLEFHSSFHKNFNPSVDTVELVRFTFSRTTFRTSHHGCRAAPNNMGVKMLMPQKKHVQEIERRSGQRSTRLLPPSFAWTSQALNEEQKDAVKKVAAGKMSPMPYIIFGPPGTGKTTTLVEAVYQLARLRGGQNQQKLKILLVAPSNDATDVLVTKLAPYFPPSEMIRVLAYSRSIDQVSPIVRPYVREGLAGTQLGDEIMSVQIVVSTVNLAARFWCLGVEKGHFDVLCVDEAGHATEPEVIATASSLMNFTGAFAGQIVLAGDPMQLGPIITSTICKKFGMAVSYMERLVKTSPAYNSGSGDNPYPPELVTFLVRNYRSHPAILKLPNEMFYMNKLMTCGDKMTTHSMAKWEHLPTKKGFPVVFHAVDGENLREGNSPSWYNPQECIEVVSYVNLLVKHSRPAIKTDEIGIITPYARQVQKIRIALKARDLGDVAVGSVETFQGQERRCIIISTVRSENELLSHDIKYNLGFVANEKRFNVAVTRAKALLVVVGNPRVLATDKNNWLPFLRYCRDNGSWFGDEWDETDVSDDDNEALLTDSLAKLKLESNDLPSEEEWEVLDHPSAAVEQGAHGFINREE